MRDRTFMAQLFKEHATWEIRWLLKEKHGGEMTSEAKKDIARLKRGEPVDYVIGWADFLGCRIDLSKRSFISEPPRIPSAFSGEMEAAEKRTTSILSTFSRKWFISEPSQVAEKQTVFIPRSETEYWIQKAIENIQMAGVKRVIRCLDIFAGSGCIGIALLYHLPNAFVDFVEKEEAPLMQIAINTALNEIDSSRYRIIQSDVFSSLKAGEHYDYIFANPPYIAEARKEDVQKSVLAWEPHVALFGKEDGLYYITLLLREAKKYLEKEGKMYIEFDSPQKTRIASLLRHYGYTKTRFSKDQYGKWRWVEASH